MKQALENLESELVRHGETFFAGLIRRARGGSDEELRAFLVSNELWGGSGSIADSAGVHLGRDARRSIEAAIVELGREQVRQVVVNVRTEMWVSTFLKWQRDGV